MRVKNFLAIIKNRSLQDNIEAYIVHGTLLSLLKPEDFSNGYEELKEFSDNDSGLDGKDEIFSFFFDSDGKKNQIDVELKLYFKEKKIIGDSLCFSPGDCPLGFFVDLVPVQNLSFFVHKNFDDEGAVYMDSGVVVRFKRLPLISYIHQIEGGFKIGGDLVGSSRRGFVEKDMREINFSDL